MKMVLFLLVVVPGLALAKGGHDASVADLLWPAVSFSTLFSILGYKLAKAMKNYFVRKAEEVKSSYEEAATSIEKSTSLHKEISTKLGKIDSEKDQISKSFIDAASEYEAKMKEETTAQLERIGKEQEAMIEYERNKLEFGLKSDLVEDVMKIAREKISQDKKKNEAASKNILGQIQ